MKRIRMAKLWLASALLFAALPMGALAQADAPDAGENAAEQRTPHFDMETSQEGGRLEVAVSVKEATDVYAYEVEVKYDALRWRLTDTVTQPQGFAVKPISSGHRLRVAHTQMGPGKGKNGDMKLALLTFERIRGGDSRMGLESVRLVNSDIKGTDYESELSIELADMGWTAIPLSDIAGHWAEEVITEAVDLGYATGYEDLAFRPEGEVTRAQFAVMLARAFMLPSDIDGAASFSDRDEIPAWAAPHIVSAVRSGLVTGYEDGTFKPNDPITRLEMAAIIVRALDPEDGEVDPSKQSFSDHDRIPVWGQSYAAAAAEFKLMQGRTDGRFAPGERASRAEAATVIMNALIWQLQ